MKAYITGLLHTQDKFGYFEIFENLWKTLDSFVFYKKLSIVLFLVIIIVY